MFFGAAANKFGDRNGDAPYHSRFIEKLPTTVWTVGNIKELLAHVNSMRIVFNL